MARIFAIAAAGRVRENTRLFLSTDNRRGHAGTTAIDIKCSEIASIRPQGHGVGTGFIRCLCVVQANSYKSC